MLQPKRVKRRRVHRGRMKGRATRGNIIKRGEYALVALAPHWITANQIEAARVAIRNSLTREGQLWINIFPHKPVTARPAETRMGAGKGAPEYWVAVVKPDRILFELGGVTEEQAKDAFRRAAAKLPIRTKFVTKEEQEGGGVNESK